MALPPIEDNEAGWATGLLMAAFALWKIWLRLRQDTRTDASSSGEHKAKDDVVKLLRDEVRRLADSVRELGEQLDEERQLRYATERRAADLQARVEVLERRLRDLGHTP